MIAAGLSICWQVVNQVVNNDGIGICIVEWRSNRIVTQDHRVLVFLKSALDVCGGGSTDESATGDPPFSERCYSKPADGPDEILAGFSEMLGSSRAAGTIGDDCVYRVGSWCRPANKGALCGSAHPVAICSDYCVDTRAGRFVGYTGRR